MRSAAVALVVTLLACDAGRPGAEASPSAAAPPSAMPSAGDSPPEPPIPTPPPETPPPQTGAVRCAPTAELPRLAEAPGACATAAPTLPEPERARFAASTWLGCGFPALDGGGALLVHIDRRYCCGYDAQDGELFAPGAAPALAPLPHRPRAFGQGADGFLVLAGDPRSLVRIDHAGVRADAGVPFPFDPDSMRYAPYGYVGPYDGWPDDEGGLVVFAGGIDAGGAPSLWGARVAPSGDVSVSPFLVHARAVPPEGVASDGAHIGAFAAGVDGAGRLLVLWRGAACDGVGGPHVLARWFDAAGAPLGAPFAVAVRDDARRGSFLRLADGSLALHDLEGRWLARFAGGLAAAGPVPGWLEARSGAVFSRTPSGLAAVTPPCRRADRRGAIELLSHRGASCGTVLLPEIATCDVMSPVPVAIGPDGSVAHEEPPTETGGPLTCTYRVWRGLLP